MYNNSYNFFIEYEHTNEGARIVQKLGTPPDEALQLVYDRRKNLPPPGHVIKGTVRYHIDGIALEEQTISYSVFRQVFPRA